MKRRNKQKVYNPYTLDKLIKANKQIQDLKKNFSSLLNAYEEKTIEEVKSYKRWKICQLYLGHEHDKVEYLKFVVLNRDNMTDIAKIAKAKDEYKIWERQRNQQVSEECKQFSEDLLIGGKRIRIEV